MHVLGRVAGRDAASREGSQPMSAAAALLGDIINREENRRAKNRGFTW
jgi:hypothetical protein